MTNQDHQNAYVIASDIGQPVLFRTSDSVVFESTLRDGSIWLRSDAFYRGIEDQARRDDAEASSVALMRVALTLQDETGASATAIHDSGARFFQNCPPHYMLCLHGISISPRQRLDFGNHTFGIRNFAELCKNLFYQAQKQLPCSAYFGGPVIYQNTAMTILPSDAGPMPIRVGAKGLAPFDSNIFRKAPVLPFIEQDEWRLVILTEGYLNGDATLPLKLNVDPTFFYRS